MKMVVSRSTGSYEVHSLTTELKNLVTTTYFLKMSVLRILDMWCITKNEMIIL